MRILLFTTIYTGLVSGGRDGMVRLYESNFALRTEFDIRQSLGGVYVNGNGTGDAAAVCTV
jgi:hypothetical protein